MVEAVKFLKWCNTLVCDTYDNRYFRVMSQAPDYYTVIGESGRSLFPSGIYLTAEELYSYWNNLNKLDLLVDSRIDLHDDSTDTETWNIEFVNKLKRIIQKSNYQPFFCITLRRSIQIEYHHPINNNYLEFEVYNDRIDMLKDLGGVLSETSIDESEIADELYNFFNI